MNIENLRKLRDLSAELDEKKAVIVKKKSDFAMTLQLDNERVENLESQIVLYKMGIESDALAEHEETGSKQLAGGIKIQDKTDVKIVYNNEKALEFAKEKGLFLQLDKKSFEKALPNLGKLDWLTKTETPFKKVTFPKVIKLED